MPGLRLLQVCNVGRVVGGTGACAWTVTRALPEFEHRVVFLSEPDGETVEAFEGPQGRGPAASGVRVEHHAKLTREVVEGFGAEVVLLHNTSRGRIVGPISAPTILYLHSAIRDRAEADVTVCCSHWLAGRLGIGADQVLWQGVGGDLRSGGVARSGDRPQHESAPRCVAAHWGRLIVGRICTPVARKWPRGVLPFYEELAGRCPWVDWEFVGCPKELEEELRQACGGRAVFHRAGWEQRALPATWNVLLYSNRELPESFGRTAAEAMRAGCVPVVDRLGGFIEQVPDGGGFLCATRDEFARALATLSKRGTWREKSSRASRHANEMFSWERFGRELRRWVEVVKAEVGRRKAEGGNGG